MKTSIRVPTTQYGYLEFEFKGTPEEAIVEHNRIHSLYNQPEQTAGLDTKNWQKVLDQYLMDGTMYEENMSAMSDRQRLLINEIKKALNRIKARNE